MLLSLSTCRNIRTTDAITNKLFFLFLLKHVLVLGNPKLSTKSIIAKCESHKFNFWANKISVAYTFVSQTSLIVLNMFKSYQINENCACQLPEALVKKAKDELREDEQIRENHLRQFREWIDKHPRIRRCQTDDRFLLRFLRVRKFNFPAACETLESYLTMRETHPHWCKNLDINDPKLEEVLQSGICLFLPNTSDLCPTTIYRTSAKFNKKFNSCDVMKMYNILLEILSDDEIVQVNGINIFSDESFASLDYWMLLSLSEWKIIADFWRSGLPLRFKNCTILNLPDFARRILNLILAFCTEKIRNRFQVLMKPFFCLLL